MTADWKKEKEAEVERESVHVLKWSSSSGSCYIVISESVQSKSVSLVHGAFLKIQGWPED